jgi:hypothetical protein
MLYRGIGRGLVTRRNGRHLGLKSIAAPGDRFDQPRAVASKRSSQFADALHQRIVGGSKIRPNRRKQLVFRD